MSKENKSNIFYYFVLIFILVLVFIIYFSMDFNSNKHKAFSTINNIVLKILQSQFSLNSKSMYLIQKNFSENFNNLNHCIFEELKNMGYTDKDIYTLKSKTIMQDINDSIEECINDRQLFMLTYLLKNLYNCQNISLKDIVNFVTTNINYGTINDTCNFDKELTNDEMKSLKFLMKQCNISMCDTDKDCSLGQVCNGDKICRNKMTSPPPSPSVPSSSSPPL
jgi:hypothetical protein